jgi:cyclophilin family peptidyl-prolyl cis-trans isomerase
MVAVIEMDWQDILDTKPFPESPARQLFTNTIISVAAQAKAALPEANGRVDRARDLVLGGLVSRNADGTFTVYSQSERGKSYTVTEKGCQCPDAEKNSPCKHLISTWVWRKSHKVLEQQAGEATSIQPTSPVETSETTSTPTQFLTEIHGRLFVQ